MEPPIGAPPQGKQIVKCGPGRGSEVSPGNCGSRGAVLLHHAWVRRPVKRNARETVARIRSRPQPVLPNPGVGGSGHTGWRGAASRGRRIPQGGGRGPRRALPGAAGGSRPPTGSTGTPALPAGRCLRRESKRLAASGEQLRLNAKSDYWWVFH